MYCPNFKDVRYTFNNDVEYGDTEYFNYEKLTWSQANTDYNLVAVSTDENDAYNELKEHFVDVDNVEEIL